MNIERITPIIRPGWDCIYGAHCEFTGDPSKNHGIHGDEYHYGVRAELADGRMVAVSLVAFTNRYPSTVPASHWTSSYTSHLLRGYPFGASIDFHLQLARGESLRDGILVSSLSGGPFTVSHPCEFLGDGRGCQVLDSSGLQADRIYRDHGTKDGPGVDLNVQSDAFYNELIGYMKRRIGVIT